MINEINVLFGSFPKCLHKDVNHMIRVVGLKSDISCQGSFSVNSCRDVLEIPDRVYYEKIEMLKIALLSPLQRSILDCIFSRHCDGLIRADSLRKIFVHVNDYEWIIPYIIELSSEYVIEILFEIEKNIQSINRDTLRAYISENRQYYITKIRSRIVSYWDCYYRDTYPCFDDYVGKKIIDYLNKV